MASPYEQDLSKIRGALHIAQLAKSNYQILQQHRPLVDAVRFALGLLDRMRPGDETLKNTAIMFRMGHTKVRFGDRYEYVVTDKHAVRAALDRIDDLFGPFDDSSHP